MKQKTVVMVLNNSDEKLFEARIKDLINIAQKNAVKRASNFLDPGEQQMAEYIAGKFPGIGFYFEGGYPEAERRIMIVFPDYLEEQPFVPPLGALRVTPTGDHKHPGHRDYLGAILGLGIAREKTGDLLVGREHCDVILKEEVLEYIGLNLARVGSVPVSVEEISTREISRPNAAFKEVKGTVASMRLDAVASLAFGISRSKITPYIKGENLRVNFKTVKDPSTPVKEGDVISAARLGRIKVIEVGGQSKKGRTFIKIHKYASK